MTKQDRPDRKDFVDPSTVSAIGLFAIQSAFKAIFAWVGLEAFKAGWEKVKNWGRKHERPVDEGIPQEESGKET